MVSKVFALAACASLLAGCVSVPNGPSVAVMPSPGKPFDVFMREDQACRQYADSSAGGSARDTANSNFAGTAALGTVIGAAAGALVGGHRGAGVGAAAGLVAGTAAGASNAGYSGQTMQQRYDVAYQQCMYSYGNQLPQAYRYQRPYAGAHSEAPPAVPPGSAYPPPNYPPPAPPR